MIPIQRAVLSNLKFLLPAACLALSACSFPSLIQGSPTNQGSYLSASDLEEVQTAVSGTIAAMPDPTALLQDTSQPAGTGSEAPRLATPTGEELPCSPQWCIVAGHFLFELPITPPGVTRPDPTYLYGSSEYGSRPPHHGVEFVNPAGTPILAAGDGTVEFAGMDHQVKFGNSLDYYGNLVILRHNFQLDGKPIFTLYGHMSKVLAQTGASVKQGQIIGEVGKSGVALGTHLHFEVRVGKNDYAHSTNPLLWLPLNQDSNGHLDGMIAGTIMDPNGRSRFYPNIRIQPDSQSSGPADPVYDPLPYTDSSVPGDPVWQEVFVQANLPAGWYQVTLTHANQPQTIKVEVRPGKVTLVHFTTED